MAAYVIYHQTELSDPDAYRRDYQQAALASIERFGGRPLVGGPFETLEGDAPGHRIVVHEFPDMETLKRWYNSEEFQKLIPVRQGLATGHLIVADGI